jgi:four helix bundle protein
MKNQNPLLDKSYAFSLRIIRCCQYLKKAKKEFELAKQLLKSGTSIGANAKEATAGFSKKNFIFKLQISLKEAKETEYWLQLLRDSKILEEKIAESILSDCVELIWILTKILKSSKEIEK